MLLLCPTILIGVSGTSSCISQMCEEWKQKRVGKYRQGLEMRMRVGMRMRAEYELRDEEVWLSVAEWDEA